jgi:predicted transcriptional regulator
MATTKPPPDRAATVNVVNVSTRGIEMFFGPLEAATMRAVWSGDRTTRQIYGTVRNTYTTGRSNDLAFTTITTTLTRLLSRGYVRREYERGGFIYTPTTASEADFVYGAIDVVLDALLVSYPRETLGVTVAMLKRIKDAS